MIEDERLLGKPADELRRGRKLLRIEEKVVGEAKRRQLSDAVEKRFTEEEPRIRLVLDDMPNADELRPLGELPELIDDVRAPQVDPADNTADERIGSGQFQQPATLLEGLPRLHGDGAGDPLRGGKRREIRRQMVVRQPLHPLLDPGILGGGIAPEMLVGIDPHGGGSSGQDGGEPRLRDVSCSPAIPRRGRHCAPGRRSPRPRRAVHGRSAPPPR